MPILQFPKNSNFTGKIKYRYTSNRQNEYQIFKIKIERPLEAIGTECFGPEIISGKQRATFRLRAYEITSQKLDLEKRLLKGNAIVVIKYITSDNRKFFDCKNRYDNPIETFHNLDKELTLRFSLQELSILSVRAAIGFSRMRDINQLPVSEKLRRKIACPKYYQTGEDRVLYLAETAYSDEEWI